MDALVDTLCITAFIDNDQFQHLVSNNANLLGLPV